MYTLIVVFTVLRPLHYYRVGLGEGPGKKGKKGYGRGSRCAVEANAKRGNQTKCGE
jgi:hypothetical protein